MRLAMRPGMQLTESTSDVASKGLRASIPEVLPALEARALRLTRSRADADDLLQETVVRALRFESTFQRGTNLRAWMHQILQSVFISRCRRRVRERRALERFTGDPTLTARMTSAPVLNCVSEKMHAAYVALPERYRGVVELVDLRDHSYREAAEVLGIPVGTVMSRLFRARRMLQELLGADGEVTAPSREATEPEHHQVVPPARRKIAEPRRLVPKPQKPETAPARAA
jgi:RNA polymerase sigma-70 factor (ECF subfamily)